MVQALASLEKKNANIKTNTADTKTKKREKAQARNVQDTTGMKMPMFGVNCSLQILSQLILVRVYLHYYKAV